jgi:DnaK suppressor protein
VKHIRIRKESKMVKIDTEKLRARLLEEKARLEADRAKLSVKSGAGMSEEAGELGDFDMNHPADASAVLFEREKELALDQNLDELLARVNEALKKLEEGTYGRCEVCGRSISAARLEALPYAVYCIDCQERIDQQ